MEVLTTQLKEQAAQIQRSAHSLKRANLRRKWSTILKAALSAVHNQPSRFSARRLFCLSRLRFFELALVLVLLDYVVSFIVNANHSILSSAAATLSPPTYDREQSASLPAGV